MAINEELKKLYNTITGKTAEGMTIDEIISELNANYPAGGGGSSLPTVTSDDNGDVLTVVEGAWAKAAPSGGDNDFIIEGGLDLAQIEITGTTVSAAEINAAIEAKKNIRLVASTDTPFDAVLELPFIEKGANNSFYFSGVIELGGAMYVAKVLFKDNGSGFEPTLYLLPYVPEIGLGNDGKVLGVDDGVYALLDHFKPTYEFGFTVERDGQGGYTATADTGSTYAAITAALAITPNVIAKVIIPSPGQQDKTETHRVIISDNSANGLYHASNVIYNSGTLNAPILIQLDISSSDVLTPRLIVLATATP